MALLATLQEPFTGSSVPSGWSEAQLGSATITYDSTGATVVLPASTTAATDGDVTSNTTFDLTGSFARLCVLGVSGAAADSTDNVLRVRQNADNYVSIFYEAGTLYFSKVVATVQTNIASVTYNATNHAWWRIRENNGITNWETSANGVDWTTQTSQTTPITVTSVDVLIGAICFGVDTNPAPFKFRYFNYPLPGTTTSTSSTSMSSTSMSSTSSSISSTSSSTSTSSTSTSYSSISTSSTSSSTTTSSTSSSISSTSSSISSTSSSSTSNSTSISSTSSSISSTSVSSTSLSSTSSSTSLSSTSSSFSSTSSSVSSTSRSTSSTSFSSTSSSSSTSTTAIPLNLDYSYQDDDALPSGGADDINLDSNKNVMNVAVDDGDYFIQYGSEYMVQEYKEAWTNSTDIPTFTYKGRTTYDTRVSPLYVQIYKVSGSSGIDNLSVLNTYYFDASDGGPTDPDTNWTNDANAADGLITTFADETGNIFGTSSVGYLKIDGTNAIDNSLVIMQVRARINGYSSSSSTGLNINANIYTDGLAELLGTATVDGTSTPGTWGSYVTLSTPTSGWTWATVQALETKIIPTGADVVAQHASKVEIEVKSAPNTGWETLAVINTIPADTDFQITVSKSTNLSDYYQII